eukprot:gb/GECH01014389.1/.p1 GENE.gb/GECH01014389.1/~~gb/GECH01014389.1/.p1  ORF type:complete len:500 (+),score=165.68 gb/GECH01014389.1/:1-1500(+)
MEELQERLLKAVDEKNNVSTLDLSKNWNINHQQVVGALKSLEQNFMLESKQKQDNMEILTDEAKECIDNNTPEVRLFHAIPKEGIEMSELEKKFGKQTVGIGMKNGAKAKWFSVEKIKEGDKVVGKVLRRAVDSVEDNVQKLLIDFQKEKELSSKDHKVLKQRKLLSKKTIKYFLLQKGPKFALQVKKPVPVLTSEMIQSGSWRQELFKSFNFNALGKPVRGGALHPLLKVRSQFKEIFLELGFEEMPTNNFVESSFWNFDALFQPQQHPARDAHDTFFLTDPEKAPDVGPNDYVERVRKVHQEGGYGSIGYRYNWKLEEAEKNVLRTHTTAVSSRVLYQMAQDEEFRPRKFFSIDRVFRNETVDDTHLCEFQQVEGMVVDRDLTLGDMIGLFSEFFKKIGIEKLKFKPAYNPYTEPSMEIFGYHPDKKEWMEVGNSGIFRPEMLRPMGLPDDVRVLAWGLSLERPTMIMYGISNIRELVGHQVQLDYISNNPVCRLDK